VVAVSAASDLGAAEGVLRRFTDEVYVEPGARRLTARADGLSDMLAMGEAIAASGIAIDDLGLARPSLDDVFLHLTGHKAEDQTETDLEEVAS
jgi:ABC-2 type transport system ATP-binding protein